MIRCARSSRAALPTAKQARELMRECYRGGAAVSVPSAWTSRTDALWHLLCLARKVCASLSQHSCPSCSSGALCQPPSQADKKL
jgi:hypothetical protein